MISIAMMHYTQTALASINEALAKVASEAENSLQMSERSCQILQSYIVELKKFIQGYTFKDRQEEILFFKEIEPIFIRE